MKLSYAVAAGVLALFACSSTDESGVRGPVQSGLGTRPLNTTCFAPERMQPRTSVALERRFGSATFPGIVGLVTAPSAGAASRAFAVQKSGLVTEVSAAGTGAVFADVRALVNAGPQEAGLLGFAFHPRFAENGEVFLSYTAKSSTSPANLRSVIARFKSTDGGRTLPALADEILSFDQPFANHNGGHIAFGPDGFLYAAFGDGGSAGDPLKAGQDKTSLFGKILRLDVNGVRPYAIPPTNPFARGGGRPEIYAYGLRNTWRFHFDRLTGDLWAGDVGQNAFEEIDKIVLGGNYGWSIREGKHCFGRATCTTEGFEEPIWEYDRSQGVSVTGGFVYRGSLLPNLYGAYLYSDFGSGRIWALFPERNNDGTVGYRNEVVAETGLNIASFAEDAAGEISVLDFVGGKVFSLAPAPLSAMPSRFPRSLKETGCFDSTDVRRPGPALIAYDVNSPLWSDGAEKERYFAIPDGKTIGVSSDFDLDLPIGSVTVKTFFLGGRRVETRLFVRHSDGGWAGYSYEWADDESDAFLLADGKTKNMGSATWTYPSRAQCFQCHGAAAGFTLGLEGGQLNRAYVRNTGIAGNYWDDLQTAGFFSSVPASGALIPKFETPSATPASGSFEEGAKAYLHANCSFCHRPGGTGRGDLDLRATTPAASNGLCDRAPSSGGFGLTDPRLVAPGDASRSVLSFRVRSPGEGRMPPLASNVVDPVGTAVVDGWVNALLGCPP